MEDFKAFFEQNYQGSEAFVASIIQPIFGGLFTASSENILLTNPSYKMAAERANILAIHRFGSCDLDVPMQFFDITLNDHVNITHSRVYIQQLLRQLIETYSTALIVFHYEDNLGDWRVSYVSKGSNAADATSAKRYTYLMGANQKCRTAAERFTSLITKEKTAANITEAFSVETLTKEFYKELFNWYQWANDDKDGFEVTFPNDTSTDTDDRKIDEHIIRLITRLMFVWFIKQKNLVPNNIFVEEELKNILSTFDPTSKTAGNYYNAILQNLFFATLNKPIKERAFTTETSYQGIDEHYGIKTLFRDAKEGTWFKKSKEEVIQIFKQVPFLNGGLFECLDKESNNNKIFYYDGFSRKAGRQKRAFLPNCLFFDPEKGLIPLLEKYNFTIEENTPTEVEVALDPELLGKVFENLLGAYNPETKETARKQSGSFYTPREIVNYMVDESLIAYLINACPDIEETNIRQLFAQDILPEELHLSPENCIRLTAIIKAAKMLDPACGSGAFPMGMLNRMLDILQKLSFVSVSVPIPVEALHATSLQYDTKLYLIENCIYGIDILTIAVQITKLRFFISLICEQTPTNNVEDNYGIKALPNLETQFVAANTLIGLAKKAQQGNLFENPEVEITKKALKEIRHSHFSATKYNQKKEFRKQDAILRLKLAKLLEENGDFASNDANQLSDWNPYDQNSSSPFFDAEWMFGMKDGFDMVVGNPPYVVDKNLSKTDKRYFEQNYQSALYQINLYLLFIEKASSILKEKGLIALIVPNTWLINKTVAGFRKYYIENYKIRLIADLTKVDVFDATVLPVVFFASRQKIRDNYSIIVDTYFEGEFLYKLSVNTSDILLDKEFMINYQLHQTDRKLLNKIEVNSIFLNQISLVSFGVKFYQVNKGNPKQTREIVENHSFSHDLKINIHCKKILEGKNVERYSLTESNKWIEYGNWLAEPRKTELFEGERILLRRIVGKGFLVSTYVDGDYCNNSLLHTVKVINQDINVKFLLAILNSKLIGFYFITRYARDEKTFPEIRIHELESLPIKNATNQQLFIDIVNQILILKKENPKADTITLEKQIDHLVYKLYDLTYEEVKVVDKDFGLSEAEYAAVVV